MNNAGQPGKGNEPKGDRQTRFSQAGLRVNETLDMETAPWAVMEAARYLMGGTRALINAPDGFGRVGNYLPLGLEPGEAGSLK